ncbi:MAG TPA: FG-GAP-like repeat-containing protein [Niastella sp.]
MCKKLLLHTIFILVFKTTFAQPVIHAISPSSGAVGSAVIITGENFNTIPGNNIVYFGFVKAAVTSCTSTELTVTVPIGVAYAPVTVTTGGLTAYSTQPFIVTYSGGGKLIPESFKSQMDISTVTVTAFAVADMNGDGKCDLITSDDWYTQALSVYPNTSNGGVMSFGPKISVIPRWGLHSIVIGDLDGDGNPDIVVSAYDRESTGFSVFRNTSTGGMISLGPRIDYSSGNNAGSSIDVYRQDVAINDLDADGKPDIAVRNGDTTMSVFRNVSTGAGDISFDVKQDFPIGSGPGNITISDLDGDNKPDLIVTNSDNNTITLFRNTSARGNLSFVSSTLTAETSPQYASVGDLDNDGKNELVVACDASHKISIFRNNSTVGNISFEAAAIDNVINNAPKCTAIADVDGDGIADVIVAEADYDHVHVFRHKNDKTFIAFDEPVSYTAAHRTFRIATGDLDADGTTDIVSYGPGQNGNLAVFKNRVRYPYIDSITPSYGIPGTVVSIKGRNFANCSAVNFGTTAAAAFTVLSDSVISATVGTGPTGVISITVPLATVNGPFFSDLSAPVIRSFQPASGEPGTVVTLNGSNFDTEPNNNLVYFGDIKATVLSASTDKITVKVPAGAGSQAIKIICRGLTAGSSNQFNLIFKGAPATILPTSLVYRHIRTPRHYALVTSDVDGDGKTDVIASGAAGSAAVYLNYSTKIKVELTSAYIFKTDIGGPMVVSDVNGDGRPDLIFGDEGYSMIYVLKNISTIGSPAFAQKIGFNSGAASDLKVGDVDGDGMPDIVAIDRKSNGAFCVLSNAGSPDSISFRRPIYFAAGGLPNAIELRDLNNDGKPEVMVTNSITDNIYVYLNTGHNGHVSFADPLIYNTKPTQYMELYAGDLNNDSLTDLVTWDLGDTYLSILRNASDSGTVNFAPYTVQPTIRQYLCIFPDIDGDTKPDVIIGGGNWWSVLKNISENSVMAFKPGADYYLDGGTVNGVAMGDLDGDGKPDVVLTTPGAPDGIRVLRNKINEPSITPWFDYSSQLTIDSVVQTYRGYPYVPRHYNIKGNAGNVTMTLYFSQEDFDKYNSFPGHGNDLPFQPSDEVNKSNLLIFGFHNVSESGLPGTFGAEMFVINPDDDKIVWNENAQWWEVTFNVGGLGGFFAASVNNPIPLQLISFTAKASQRQALIAWTTRLEENVSHFDLQRRSGNGQFSNIAQIPATNLITGNTYKYTDDLGADTVYYYRLGIINNDGSIEYSKVISIKIPSENVITISPNPAKDMVWVHHPVSGKGSYLLLIDMAGRVIKTITPAIGSTTTGVYLKGLGKGAYQLVYRNKADSFTSLIFVQ